MATKTIAQRAPCLICNGTNQSPVRRGSVVCDECVGEAVANCDGLMNAAGCRRYLNLNAPHWAKKTEETKP